jgi:hypothetical protein
MKGIAFGTITRMDYAPKPDGTLELTLKIEVSRDRKPELTETDFAAGIEDIELHFLGPYGGVVPMKRGPTPKVKADTTDARSASW